MKNLGDWKENLKLWLKRRKSLPTNAYVDAVIFFDQTFQFAQEPSASWFGIHVGRVSLVIGNLWLAAIHGDGTVWLMVDDNSPAVEGFEFVPVGKTGAVKWLRTSEVGNIRHLVNNKEVWASYSRASYLVLTSPYGAKRKDEHYLKTGKERVSDFWPVRGRGNLFQEISSQEKSLRPLSKTEYETVVNSRIGQGRFRQSLIDIWERCSVTGCEDTRVLRASHLKPWADSSNDERLDPHNGLLLIPNLDAALDQGLVTFDDSGKIKISSQISAGDLAKLGLEASMKLSILSKSLLKYLKYHREKIFKG